MLRSKKVSSHTDLNVGKGQTSAGKSQSVTQANSYLLLNMCDLELSVLENSMSKRMIFWGKVCLLHRQEKEKADEGSNLVSLNRKPQV